MPMLTHKQEYLERPRVEEAFIKVNKSAPAQKSPGPDGFSEFYKRTSDIIAGKLTIELFVF